ncbi:MAG: Molybdenum cofactor guanylyltransferase [Ignavibacteria bacterium]|nr:Molybdenum cofactor guanylyltransferase [Ignavibacteria bacterium]
MKNSEITDAVILSAGFSSRMKSHKAFLYFENKKTFLEKIIGTYTEAGIKNIFVVINSEIESKAKDVLSGFHRNIRIRLILNESPEKGRFFSIRQGLQKSEGDFCFLQNIDNPFISAHLLTEMLNVVKDNSYVVPAFYEKEGHPLLLSSQIVKYLLSLTEDSHHLRKELSNFEKIKLQCMNEGILTNINSVEDYKKYFFYL